MERKPQSSNGAQYPPKRTIFSARIAEIFNATLEPSLYILILAGTVILWRACAWPSPETVFENLIQQLRTEGWYVVLIASFLEGLVLINIYVPGSVVVAAAIIASKGNCGMIFQFATISYTMFVLSGCLNFYIGKKAFCRLAALIERYSNSAALSQGSNSVLSVKSKPSWAAALLMIHPNLGALYQVHCGRNNIPISNILPLILVGYFISIGFWTAITLLFTKQIKIVATNPWLIFSILSGWWLWSLVGQKWTHKKSDVES